MANCALLDAARIGNIISGTSKFEALAWEYAIHTHNRLANYTDVSNRTPFELNCGIKPVFSVLGATCP